MVRGGLDDGMGWLGLTVRRKGPRFGSVKGETEGGMRSAVLRICEMEKVDVGTCAMRIFDHGVSLPVSSSNIAVTAPM